MGKCKFRKDDGTPRCASYAVAYVGLEKANAALRNEIARLNNQTHSEAFPACPSCGSTAWWCGACQPKPRSFTTTCCGECAAVKAFMWSGFGTPIGWVCRHDSGPVLDDLTIIHADCPKFAALNRAMGGGK